MDICHNPTHFSYLSQHGSFFIESRRVVFPFLSHILLSLTSEFQHLPVKSQEENSNKCIPAQKLWWVRSFSQFLVISLHFQPPPLIPLNDLPPLKEKKIIMTPLSPPGSGTNWFSTTKISWPCNQSPNIRTYSEFDDGFSTKSIAMLKKNAAAMKFTRSLSETMRCTSSVSPQNTANSKPSLINWNLSMSKYLLARKKPAPKPLSEVMKKRFSFTDISAHSSKIAPLKKATKRHSIDSTASSRMSKSFVQGAKTFAIDKKHNLVKISSSKSTITLLKSPDTVAPSPISEVSFFKAALAEFDQ